MELIATLPRSRRPVRWAPAAAASVGLPAEPTLDAAADAEADGFDAALLDPLVADDDAEADAVVQEFASAAAAAIARTSASAPRSLPASAGSRTAGRQTGPNRELLLQLIHQVQARCPRAFEHLYALTSPRLFGVILRINRDRAEAEDVLQDVFVKIWQQSGRFDSQHGDVAAWLAAIAHNTAISSLRRRSCRPQHSTDAPWQSDEGAAESATDGLPCSSAGPQEQAMQLQAGAAVRASLHRLNAEQREGLLLAFFEGLSHQEIAARLGRPLGTVKSTVRRALIALRPTLRGHSCSGVAG